MSIIVEHNQSFLDIATSTYGNVAQAVAMALASDRSLSDVLVAGEQVMSIDATYELSSYVRYETASSTATSTIAIVHNQSLLDVSIQETGDVRQAIALAILNDRPLSNALIAGMEIKSGVALISRAVVESYQRVNYIPATALTQINTGTAGVYELGVFEINVFE